MLSLNRSSFLDALSLIESILQEAYVASVPLYSSLSCDVWLRDRFAALICALTFPDMALSSGSYVPLRYDLKEATFPVAAIEESREVSDCSAAEYWPSPESLGTAEVTWPMNAEVKLVLHCAYCAAAA